ncbi:MAG: hypothetical protein WBD40_22515 [Tepidisphaeraceae bacterium]
MSKRKVISAVKKRLDEVGHGIDFDIVEAGVRADGDWWYLPVLSHKGGKDVRREVTVSIFANVENELHKSENLTVLLIPVVE